MHASRTGLLCGLLGLWALVAAAGCMRGTAGPGHASGATLYDACASCHGDAGQGNATLGAPRIAGMPAWYVASQVTRFQTDLRGKHPDDAEGLRMRAMARQMLTDAETTAVADYVASLPPVVNAPTLTGVDLAAGAQAFAVCVGCHGPDGKGNEAIKAAPLAGQDDWYLALQIRKFQTGVRGMTPGDTVGPVMQAMSMTIPSDAVANVSAYAHSLAK